MNPVSIYRSTEPSAHTSFFDSAQCTSPNARRLWSLCPLRDSFRGEYDVNSGLPGVRNVQSLPIVHSFNRADDVNDVLPTGSGMRVNPNVGEMRGVWWGGDGPSVF